ncbi:MAG: hypothetical protein RJA80_747, partial [Actinomycetota bacterium]
MQPNNPHSPPGTSSTACQTPLGTTNWINSPFLKSLPKTILYNLNPADNELFATMAGNFNDGKIKGKMQYGSGWWFLDQ